MYTYMTFFLGDWAFYCHIETLGLLSGWCLSLFLAGDHVKFGLPMAYSVTILAWGLIQWGDAYKSAGLTSAMYDCIRWPLDYLLRAHTGPTELYVQVIILFCF